MLIKTSCPTPMGLGLTLMNAVVAIVTLGVTPEGGAVGHEVSCGAPISSTFAVAGRKIAAYETNSTAIMTVVKIFVLNACISVSP